MRKTYIIYGSDMYSKQVHTRIETEYPGVAHELASTLGNRWACVAVLTFPSGKRWVYTADGVVDLDTKEKIDDADERVRERRYE